SRRPFASTADHRSDEAPEAERDPGRQQAEDELSAAGEKGAPSGEQGDEGADEEQTGRGAANGGDDGRRASGEEVGDERNERPHREQGERRGARRVGRTPEGRRVEAELLAHHGV